jgi:hypothetical protein
MMMRTEREKRLTLAVEREYIDLLDAAKMAYARARRLEAPSGVPLVRDQLTLEDVVAMTRLVDASSMGFARSFADHARIVTQLVALVRTRTIKSRVIIKTVGDIRSLSDAREKLNEAVHEPRGTDGPSEFPPGPTKCLQVDHASLPSGAAGALSRPRPRVQATQPTCGGRPLLPSGSCSPPKLRQQLASPRRPVPNRASALPHQFPVSRTFRRCTPSPRNSRRTKAFSRNRLRPRHSCPPGTC